MMNYVKPPVHSWRSLCVCDPGTPARLYHPSKWFLPPPFPKPVLSSLSRVFGKFASASFRAPRAQCPDHQHPSPGEPVKIQIPGL